MKKIIPKGPCSANVLLQGLQSIDTCLEFLELFFLMQTIFRAIFFSVFLVKQMKACQVGCSRPISLKLQETHSMIKISKYFSNHSWPLIYAHVNLKKLQRVINWRNGCQWLTLLVIPYKNVGHSWSYMKHIWFPQWQRWKLILLI